MPLLQRLFCLGMVCLHVSSVQAALLATARAGAKRRPFAAAGAAIAGVVATGTAVCKAPGATRLLWQADEVLEKIERAERLGEIVMGTLSADRKSRVDQGLQGKINALGQQCYGSDGDSIRHRRLLFYSKEFKEAVARERGMPLEQEMPKTVAAAAASGLGAVPRQSVDRDSFSGSQALALAPTVTALAPSASMAVAAAAGSGSLRVAIPSPAESVNESSSPHSGVMMPVAFGSAGHEDALEEFMKAQKLENQKIKLALALLGAHTGIDEYNINDMLDNRDTTLAALRDRYEENLRVVRPDLESASDGSDNDHDESVSISNVPVADRVTELEEQLKWMQPVLRLLTQDTNYGDIILQLTGNKGAASSKETSASAAATVAQAPTVNAAGAAPVVEVDQSLFSEASRVSLTRNAETARILELLRAQLTSKRTSAARSATTVKGSMVRGYRRSHAFETGKAARDRSSNSPARLAQAAAAPATTTALAASPARVAATGGSTSTTTATRRVAAPASAAAAAAPTSASDQYYPPNGSTPWGGTIYR